MSSPSITRDIPVGHRKPRKSDRAHGEVWDPVQYASEQLAFDNWNFMFLRSLCKGLTARQAESPPSNVLDVGCGSGLWVVEAARQWPDCKFIGLDYRQVQPDLKRFAEQPDISNVVDRVRWVHGNFLDPLPFKSNDFDFVRICGIGIGVPEDEWGHLLQEVSRVLIPGGYVEVIEDDLIFPCGSQPDWVKTEVMPIPKAPSTDSIPEPQKSPSLSRRLTRKSSSSRLVTSLFPSDATDDPFAYPASERIDYLEVLDPKNHAKLKAAWDRMLAKRFLPPGLLSVLQFYFTSEFDAGIAPSGVQVELPPNTRMYDAKFDVHLSDSISDAPPALPPIVAGDQELSLCSFVPDVQNDDDAASASTSPTWAAMHLGRMVALVVGCKQAIFEEWKTLDGPAPTTQNALSDMKDEFNAAWLNWECDMRDRMRMRTFMDNAIAWSREAPDEPPDVKDWRNRAGYMEVDEENPEVDHRICRSMRAFVGRKPFNRDG
ncbi:S-adenosyl-L-methionine-dependent methyltransferase [Phanerochaete sordida]|uniref:S-adenosyl-L-methionine-dependent methyltransferase n=1 Tax=Phanerochaete sordida TaxID=48140 RepID=A0A9P3LBM0_9APHY|nr:S-adenosyl-L-methionine-dependent methyltransferase [Phanerochaete sordida]